MTQDLPSEEEFLGWKSQPVTRAVLNLLQKWEASLKDQWARGQFEFESSEATAIANAGALGEVNILQKIVGMDYVEFSEGFSDE